MLTMLANAYWALCTFMKASSATAENALLWSKVLSFWPFLVPLMLHFTFVFTESDLLKNKLTYAALYLPALLFSLVDLTTDSISDMPILKPWGYETAIPDSLIVRLDGIWSAALGLLMIIVFVNYYIRVSDETKKHQAKFITLGFSIPILLSIITDSVFPSMNIDFPGLGNISGSITSFFVLYGIWRYELFNFRVEIASENVFSTMPDCVIIANLESKILKVNRALLDLTGYSELEIIGKSISEMIQKANVFDLEKNQPQFIGQMRELREIRNYEFSFYTKAGQEKNGMLSCSIVTDNRGQDVGITFVFRDVTQRKLMEQKLLRSERFASIGELAGMLGHDLRNPLSGIRGATYYLRRKLGKKLDAEDIAMFDSIDKSIDYANKIVNDLLDYSSEIRLHLTPVTPKALIADSLAFASAPPYIEVTNQAKDETEFIADETKIRRAFVNIIKNAFDAMPNGGELKITCTKTGKAFVFTFKDNGPGMSKETLEKLWTPLYTTKAKGMGFGLAICKRHIEAHEGKIWLESIQATGTTVKVELPLKKAS
jgi:PAS domain S-box-containing protein